VYIRDKFEDNRCLMKFPIEDTRGRSLAKCPSHSGEETVGEKSEKTRGSRNGDKTIKKVPERPGRERVRPTKKDDAK